MDSWVVANMGGEVPRTDPRLLPPNAAAEAWNAGLMAGPLNGLAMPVAVYDGNTGPQLFPDSTQRAYRIPGLNPGDADVWLALPSPYSSVVRSPLVNDTLHRFYWTNPGQGAFWNTYDRIRQSLPPYVLGFIPPRADRPLAVQVKPDTGTASVPQVARSYLVTYVDEFGLESSPCAPSAVVSGPPDATWLIADMILTWPTNNPIYDAVVGLNYPKVVAYRLYRTVTGLNTGGQFFKVADLSTLQSDQYITNVVDGAGGSSWYEDNSLDVDIVGNETLSSSDWMSPPALLDGLLAMPGGFLVGFTGNTLHFCEPDRPHTWPAGYDLSVGFPIVALALWQQSLTVLTAGYPSTGVGTSPAGFSVAQMQVAEPCISRGSVITDMTGVVYASPNGLILLSYAGMNNLTEPMISRDVWLTKFSPYTLIAGRTRLQYMALTGGGAGFMIDYVEPRLGVTHLDALVGAISLWTDAYDGFVYFLGAGKYVYRWDQPSAPALAYRWKSKRFVRAKPLNLGVARITASPDILQRRENAVQSVPAGISLDAGVNAMFTVWADGRQIYRQPVTQVEQRFRLPSGFIAHEWQFEIQSRSPIYRVELATTLQALQAA